MTIAFFIGPNIFALIKRFIALWAIKTALNISAIAFIRISYLFLGLISLIQQVLLIFQVLLAVGIARALLKIIFPNFTKRWRFFDDNFIIGIFGTKTKNISWIWTPLTMAALVICTVHYIDYLLELSSSNSYNYVSWDNYYSHQATVAYIGLGLSVLGFLSGTRFVSGAKDTIGGHFGVKYLPEDHALTQRVAKLAKRLGLKNNPQVGVTNVTNAFAMGTRSNAAVVIGTPLIEMLTDEELDAVIGHELGHIHSSDMQRMQFAEGFQIMLGNVITGITSIFVRFGTKSSSGAALSHSIGFLFRRIVFFATELAVKGLSRSREFVADATGAQLSSAEAMTSALKRIHGVPTKSGSLEDQYGYLMFKGASFGVLFSTHPSLEARIKNLERQPNDTVS